MATREGELRADMMRFYGVSLDDASVSWRDKAAMAAHLPSDGAVARSRGDGWSEAERLLASMEFSLRVLRWQPTRDGEKGRNQPKFAQSPAERRAEAEGRAEAQKYTKAYMDAVAESLGIPEDRR